jgi:hypothetical protein
MEKGCLAIEIISIWLFFVSISLAVLSYFHVFSRTVESRGERREAIPLRRGFGVRRGTMKIEMKVLT